MMNFLNPQTMNFLKNERTRLTNYTCIVGTNKKSVYTKVLNVICLKHLFPVVRGSIL